VRRVVVPLAVAVALAGCGGDGGAAPRVGDPAEDYLQVIVGRSDSTDVETVTLDCGGGSGEATHPDAEAACAHLAAMDDPFAPLPDDVACTEQYGGPQTANVIGRWDGEAVDVGLSRTDGCRIAQWDALGPLLPGPVG
jgi:hypothetical protein